MKEDKYIEEINKDDFAKIIKKIRKERKLTQKQFAELIEVSDRTISKWEKGESIPDLFNVKKICKSLKISPSSLVSNQKVIKDYYKDLKDRMKIICLFVLRHIVAIFLTIIFILLLIFYINNSGKVKLYKLSYYTDENMTVNGGTLFLSNTRNFLTVNGIKIIDDNYEIKDLKLKLYTLLSEDKILLYESDDLNSIYIEEMNFDNILAKDIFNAIKNNLIINIEVIDTSNQKHEYEATVSFYEDYVNNKLFYKYNKEKEFSIKTIDVLNNNDVTNSNNKRIIDNLKSNGYTYNNDKKSYFKKYQDGIIDYFINDERIVYECKNKSDDVKIIYYIIHNTIDYRMLKVRNEELIVNLKYNIAKKDLKCEIGNCKKYMPEVYEFINEIRKIISIPQS